MTDARKWLNSVYTVTISARVPEAVVDVFTSRYPPDGTTITVKVESPESIEAAERELLAFITRLYEAAHGERKGR